MTEQNDLFILAEKWVNETNQHIFLTGKAGTGKTTFLKHIKSATPKRSVVLAPTGVAAINAGGSTIHSFFRLPFATFLPTGIVNGDDENVVTAHSLFTRLRYNRQHIQLLRTVELIIIDEISMVRADVLDMIDLILRRYRFAPGIPFGGVQMLFIGDMHQLPPVVKEQDGRLLKDHYTSPYFFASHVLRDNPPVMVQLKKVYRQQDTQFLSLLNELRHNELSEDNFYKLQSIVTKVAPDDERYITLTSHVQKADAINKAGMDKLPGPAEVYVAEIEGDFPEFQYPTTTELLLKKNARVMFIKNDPEKRFYNGKIGTITRLDREAVYVFCDDDHNEIKVEPLDWDNVKYSVDKASGALDEDVVGTFRQMPLRPAWAVTIHKSQGLTFDHVVIDAEKAFASGQVYVALSRCRSFEGIVLLSQINPRSLFTDTNIVQFSEQAWKQEKLENTLPAYRHQFQLQVLAEVFDFDNQVRNHAHIMQVRQEYEHSFSTDAGDVLDELGARLLQLAKVSRQFMGQVHQLDDGNTMPMEHPPLVQRIREACSYFMQHNNQGILLPLQQLPAPPDNALASARMLQALENVREHAYVQQACWQTLRDECSITATLQARSKAIHETTRLKRLQWTKEGVITNTGNPAAKPQLEQALRKWRTETAERKHVEPYRILTNKTIDGLVAAPPQNKKELLAITGLGPKKVKEFGEELLELVGEWG